MCYHNKELQQLDPALVSSTSLLSLQQPLGVLLLEESLVHGAGPGEPPSKRPRGRKEIPPDTNKWIHLARYRQLSSARLIPASGSVAVVKAGECLPAGVVQALQVSGGLRCCSWDFWRQGGDQVHHLCGASGRGRRGLRRSCQALQSGKVVAPPDLLLCVSSPSFWLHSHCAEGVDGQQSVAVSLFRL